MNKEHRCVLRYKRDVLLNVNLEDLTQLLKEYKIFNRYMWNDISTIADMIDALPSRGPKAFSNLIDILRKAKYSCEADQLEHHALVKEIGDNSLYYVMSTTPLGYCLIINNVEFDEPESKIGDNAQRKRKDRFGSDVDAASLRDFFEKNDFHVTVERNMKASEMTACLKKFSRRDFTNVDSMIIIILSHGAQIYNKDVIHGTDGNYIYKYDVCDIFNNKNCEQLQNKPKIFFFICCRGKGLDYGVPASKCLPNESVDSNEIIMPTFSDVFIVHSTLPKQVSVRDIDRGTFFCEELVTVLKEYFRIHDLETIMKLVNKNLQNRVSLTYRTIQAAHVEALCGTKRIMFCKTLP